MQNRLMKQSGPTPVTEEGWKDWDQQVTVNEKLESR